MKRTHRKLKLWVIQDMSRTVCTSSSSLQRDKEETNYVQIIGGLLKETDGCICCALVPNRQNERESSLKHSATLNVRLPALIDYVAFCQTVPEPLLLSSGGQTQKYDRLGGLWHPGDDTGCLALLFQAPSPHVTLTAAMVYHNLHLLCSLLLYTPPPDTCSEQTEWRIPLQTSRQHLWDAQRSPLNTTPTLKLCSLIHWFPAHLSAGPTSGGDVTLMVTQQVEHKGQVCVPPFLLLRGIVCSEVMC